ncbi:MAG: DUF4236 domain-containing protein [Thermodesulforhabdaceae bacterium]
MVIALTGWAWIRNQVQQWARQRFSWDLLRLFQIRGFQVYLASDHGNIEAKGIGRPAEKAVRCLWRRIKIAPGVTLNLSKLGGSLSFGPRGAKFTIGPKGKRVTVGIPGTGLFYTTTLPSGMSGGGKSASYSTPAFPTVNPEDRLTLGFFKRLITPGDEEALVDGCRELVLGNEDKALEYLEKSVHLADGAYLAGFLALKQDRLEEAEKYLTAASEQHSRLGYLFSKYGISATMSLPITDEVSAHVGPDLRGVLLGLVEVYQRKESWGMRLPTWRVYSRLNQTT